MAIISGRGGAPGSYIYESAAAATQFGRATFNTTYMLVDTPDESSVTVFPYNRPVPINSLNEYENLIGTLPTVGGTALTSYYAVKAFFQQAVAADLRVVRVGTPSIIREVSFDPAVNKDNGVDAPSALQKDDLVYVKLQINGLELGERTRNGAWLGVPVVIPANYIPGDVDNNLAISKALRDATVAAIQENKDISAGVYIRETGEGDPSCDECAYLYLTGRIFNSPVEVVNVQEIVGNQSILAINGYTIQNVSESDRTVYDWIQAVRTAFNDPKAPQGYMTAPAAFSVYNQADRVNLGQSMEEVCSDTFHKWMAMVDCGPFDVTSINDYHDFIEHSPADGFVPGQKELVENVIYDWVDDAPLKFTSAKFDPESAERSTNSNLANGDRRALKDDRHRRVEVAANTGSNVLTLTADWPSVLKTGERADVTLFSNEPHPTAPTYTDSFTDAFNEDLVGTFYVIAGDVDFTLEPNQIKLATSRSRALGNESVDLVTAGTPQGGGMLDIEYATPAWEYNVTINEETSNVLECDNSAGASFNSLHMPGTLQKATGAHEFKAVVRQLTDPSKAIGIGGNSLKYVSTANVDVANNQLKLAAHGYSTRDKVYVQELPSATRFGLNPMGPVTSVNVAAPVQDSGDYPAGVYTNIAVNQGSGEGARATVTIVGSSPSTVANIEFTSGGMNYQVGDEIRFAKADLGGGTENLIVEVTAVGSSGTAFPTLYAIKIDENTLQLASSEINADVGTALEITSGGTDSSSILDPRGAGAQAVITTGGDLLFFSADHGLKTAEKLMFDGDITTDVATLVRGTDETRSTVYYVKVEDRNFFRLTPTASNLAAGVFTNFPSTAIETNTPVRFYRPLLNTLQGGTFTDSGLVRYIRGRKYQLDVTLSTFAVLDEVKTRHEAGNSDPYGGTYTTDLSTDFRLSASTTPVVAQEFPVGLAGINENTNEITTPEAHGFQVGQEVVLSRATNATLPDGVQEDIVYYAIPGLSNDVVKLAETAADALAGNAIALAGENAGAATDNAANVCLVITLNSNPFTFTYTEDESAAPLNSARDFAGDNNFYCVPLSYGEQAAGALLNMYGHVCLVEDNTRTALYGAQTELEFVEPKTEVPTTLWNFSAVTSAELIGEALRGVNNNGVPQAVVIETGMDNHNRLFAESQKYYTTQGFLAFFAPYILNDVGVYIPPTPYVTGLAMRRYRDEVAGFRLPPAGAKYSLAGARGVQVEISSGMQDVSNPYGLNALRQLPGYSQVDPDTGETYGPVFVWGSRTRINPENAQQSLYKFVNTRVIMNVIYGTLDGALDGQIFNIIDGRAVTFNEIRTLISNILYSEFYVPGALFGATASDAFEVIVDDRNNPPSALENGLVNVTTFVVPVPTLERIEIDLLRVNIGGIHEAKTALNLN